MLEISEKNSSAEGNLWYNINCVKVLEIKSITDRSRDAAAENKEK